MQDTIGYWRSPSAVADETDVDAARAAALRFARVARARMGWGRYLSDRYSSQVGQVIEGEESRVACLMAIIWPSKPGQAPSHRAGQQPATGQRYRASRTR